MKLEMTLPERPGMLHAIPVVNLLALLWLVSLLGPAMVQSSGVTVELPPSKFQLARYQNHLVVTIGVADEGSALYLGRDRVTFDTLSARLDAMSGEDRANRTLVLLQSDSGASVGEERRVAELILEKGFRLAVAGANQATGASPPSPTPR